MMRRTVRQLEGLPGVVVGAYCGVHLMVSKVKDAVTAAFTWHVHRWRHDPTYPGALLQVGKAVIVAMVPRAALASALVAVLTSLVSDRIVVNDRDRWDDAWADPAY